MEPCNPTAADICDFCNPALSPLQLGQFLLLPAARVGAAESPWRRAEHPIAPHSPAGDGMGSSPGWPGTSLGLQLQRGSCGRARLAPGSQRDAKVTGKSARRSPWKHSTFGSGDQSGFLVPLSSVLQLWLCQGMSRWCVPVSPVQCGASIPRDPAANIPLHPGPSIPPHPTSGIPRHPGPSTPVPPISHLDPHPAAPPG